MIFPKRDPIMQAYPFDIAGGLLLGGSVVCVFSTFYNNIVFALVGELCVIVGIFMFVGIAIGFNGGTHIKRF